MASRPTVAEGRVSALLLAWFDRHRRDLPWRRTHDPYRIWVSEVMLQQTQVSTVVAYYSRWMARFPSLEALAGASEDEVLGAWEGLGYYARARHLLAGARAVLERHAGELPSTAAELRELPGIGAYSAGAIASIAFGRREPVVDGNVRRVLCRLEGLRGDPTRAPLARRLGEVARRMVPEERPGDHNQALMELGAMLCTPENPGCSRCPLEKLCLARRQGMEQELPELPRRARTTPLRVAAAIVERRGRLLLVRHPEGATRWAGLWQFPNAEVRRTESARACALRALREQVGLAATVGELVLSLRHAVTRYRVTLHAFRCRAERGQARTLQVAELAWKTRSDLGAIAMPAAHRRLARALGGPS
jgi:A/G-specific adenine glycosylase